MSLQILYAATPMTSCISNTNHHKTHNMQINNMDCSKMACDHNHCDINALTQECNNIAQSLDNKSFYQFTLIHSFSYTHIDKPPIS